jgi:hypothetical protein
MQSADEQRVEVDHRKALLAELGLRMGQVSEIAGNEERQQKFP